MDDKAGRRYFMQPTNVYQRQYEALRAVFADGRSQKDVAKSFGFEYDSLRQLVFTFRHSVVPHQTATDSPFFKTPDTNHIQQSQTSLRNRSLPIDGNSSSPARNRSALNHERRGYSYSFRCWSNWDLIPLSAKQTIRGQRWFRLMRRCSVCSH
jgi:hypothetical protein